MIYTTQHKALLTMWPCLLTDLLLLSPPWQVMFPSPAPSPDISSTTSRHTSPCRNMAPYQLYLALFSTSQLYCQL